MIENNIIQSLGAGSGIDSRSIVKQLTEIERSGPQQRIDDKREKAESQISDFSLLRGAMNTLKGAVTALTDKEGLYSKSASFTESTALVPTDLETDVQAGVYSFEVESVAQSQSVVFESFASPSDSVGEGTLTFNFGSWTRDGSDVPTGFTVDAEAEEFVLTIDSSNNTLTGLKNSINSADMGVQASIINDGSGYRLVLTAESGNNNQLQITASEGGTAPEDVDGTGLSRFAFNTGVTDFNLLEKQKGADAELLVNGLQVFRESNQVSDVVEGLTVNILKASPGEVITVTISDDKAFAEQNIRDFVEAYNTFLEEIQPAFGYDEEEEKFGSLVQDSLAKSVKSQMRSLIASSIPGLSDSNFSALTNVGIRTELDGTISIDEDDFEKALADNFADVQKVFAPYTSSTASDIQVNSFGKQTVAGSYDVSITTQPTKGNYVGTALGIAFPFDTSVTTPTYTFNITVNDVESDLITIPTGAGIEYDSGAALAEAIQSAINADSALKAGSASVIVSYDSDNDSFSIISDKYGSASSVQITAASGDAYTDLGISANDGTSTAGRNVSGTVNGAVGFGLGNVLLPKLGNDAEGLSLIIGDNATTSTVSFSRGFAGELDRLMQQFLQTNGLFSERTSVLDRQLDDLESDEELLDRRMGIYEERLLQQFIAMETILNGLNSQGGFLDNLIESLPFTSGVGSRR